MINTARHLAYLLLASLVALLAVISCTTRPDEGAATATAPAESALGTATATTAVTLPTGSDKGAIATGTPAMDETPDPAATSLSGMGNATVTAAPLPSATVAPLTAETVASCPVSLPNLVESPDSYYISGESGYSNPEQTMFIGLWPEGKVVFHQDGPGQIASDGSLAMKFWFYRTIRGEVVIGGRRLDVPAPPMPERVLRGAEDAYDETGFHPAGLVFPTPGCWEVTARAGDESLTFVTLVVLDGVAAGLAPPITVFSLALPGTVHNTSAVITNW